MARLLSFQTIFKSYKLLHTCPQAGLTSPTDWGNRLVMPNVLTDINVSNNNMSRNGSSSKRDFSWKLSQDSSLHNIDQSRSQQSFILPQRFSPSKGCLYSSRLLNPSIEKYKLAKAQAPSEKELAPSKSSLSAFCFSSEAILKSPHDSLHHNGLKTPKTFNFALKTKDSLQSVT
jgi:hypothetical protein